VLRHVVIRTTTSGREAALVLVVSRNDKSLRAPVRALLDTPDRPDGLFINVHDRPGPFMIGPRTLRVAGRSHVREEILGTSFLISPTSFFQTNVGAAGVLLALVLQEVGAAARVLDLYSGAGLFSIPIARRGARVTAVEENRQAVEDARANARLNRVPDDRVRFVAARAEEAVARLARDRFDLVVLDPPRQGCPDRVIDAVTACGPPRIVYVSCNPDRLAEEATRFARQGYGLSRIQPIDMFPHTDHLEAVAVFEPKGPGREHR
jgi:23S rRNA (uracil1939-C5)-methyltransferase